MKIYKIRHIPSGQYIYGSFKYGNHCTFTMNNKGRIYKRKSDVTSSLSRLEEDENWNNYEIVTFELSETPIESVQVGEWMNEAANRRNKKNMSKENRKRQREIKQLEEKLEILKHGNET